MLSFVLLLLWKQDFDGRLIHRVVLTTVLTSLIFRRKDTSVKVTASKNGERVVRVRARNEFEDA